MHEQLDTIYDVPLNNPQITRHFYLIGGLENTDDYIKTCQGLYELDENDVAEIHINSGGGCTEISDMILNAMNKCQAKVKCILESNAHSAASIIFLGADEWEVAPNATMYVHVGFFGAYGEKASDTVPDAVFTEKTHFKMIESAYKGFLSDDEIKGLLKGTNIRLDSEEIIERLQGLIEYRNSQMEAAQGCVSEPTGEGCYPIQVEDVLRGVVYTQEGELAFLEVFNEEEEFLYSVKLNKEFIAYAYKKMFLDQVTLDISAPTTEEVDKAEYLLSYCKGFVK